MSEVKLEEKCTYENVLGSIDECLADCGMEMNAFNEQTYVNKINILLFILVDKGVVSLEEIVGSVDERGRLDKPGYIHQLKEFVEPGFLREFSNRSL